jgi:hypothetical protein
MIEQKKKVNKKEKPTPIPDTYSDEMEKFSEEEEQAHVKRDIGEIDKMDLLFKETNGEEKLMNKFEEINPNDASMSLEKIKQI